MGAPRRKLTTEAQKRGRRARRKGAEGELELAELWGQVSTAARRSVGQARKLKEVPDIDGVEGFWIEGKRYKTVVPLVPALRQALADNDEAARKTGKPRRSFVVACGRADQGAVGAPAPPWLAALPLRHLLEIVRERDDALRRVDVLERREADRRAAGIP